ncbi:unnamed protein product, partial [Musa hybrid cultivar]
VSAVISFLAANNYPLLLNAYPYYAYDPKYMKLDYVLLNSTTVIVQDGNLGYTNMLHAMVDTAYTAMEKVGGQTVEVVLSETGWPSGGGPAVATVEYAKIHNNNAVRLAATSNGTPKRPGRGLETFLFAMFNENLKQRRNRTTLWALLLPRHERGLSCGLPSRRIHRFLQ